MVTIITTTTTSNNKYYYVAYEHGDEEECTQLALKLLIMKQSVQTGELRYELVCEYDNIFYSGILNCIN